MIPKTVLLSVVYPSVMLFFEEFIQSILSQDLENCRLLLLSDGVKDLENHIAGKEIDTTILPVTGTATKIRIQGIRYAIEQGFTNILFIDSDDLMGPKRVAHSIRALHSSDIVFNDLVVFGGEIQQEYSWLSHRFTHDSLYGPESFFDGNALGLTNTAIRVSAISESSLAYSDNDFPFDWLFFLTNLELGASCRFLSNTHTKYRQHRQNIAPLRLTPERVLYEIRVKKSFYARMMQIHPRYASAYRTYMKLETAVGCDHRATVEILAHEPAHRLWWEHGNEIQTF